MVDHSTPDISGVILAWQTAMMDVSEPWVTRLATLLSQAVDERRDSGEVSLGGLRDVVETVCSEVGVHETLVPLQQRLLAAIYQHYPEEPLTEDQELLLGNPVWSNSEELAAALMDAGSETGAELSPVTEVIARRTWEAHSGESMTQLARRIVHLEHACRRIRLEATVATIRAASATHRHAGLVEAIPQP
jgi:hypothetical protein